MNQPAVYAKDLSFQRSIDLDNRKFSYVICQWNGKFGINYLLKSMPEHTNQEIRTKLFGKIGCQFNILLKLVGKEPCFLNTIEYYMESPSSMRHGILMEYCLHGSIMQFCTGVPKERVNAWLISLWLLQVARGFQYLHETARPAIVHGDFTLANVLITDLLNAKIGGFSTARELPDPAGRDMLTDRCAYALAVSEAFALASEAQEPLLTFAKNIASSATDPPNFGDIVAELSQWLQTAKEHQSLLLKRLEPCDLNLGVDDANSNSNAAATSNPNAAADSNSNAAATSNPNAAATSNPNAAATSNPNAAATSNPNAAATSNPNAYPVDVENSILLSPTACQDKTQPSPAALMRLCHSPDVQSVWCQLLLLLDLSPEELQRLRKRGEARRQTMPALLWEGFQLLQPLAIGLLSTRLRDIGCYDGLRLLRASQQ